MIMAALYARDRPTKTIEYRCLQRHGLKRACAANATLVKGIGPISGPRMPSLPHGVHSIDYTVSKQVMLFATAIDGAFAVVGCRLHIRQGPRHYRPCLRDRGC